MNLIHLPFFLLSNESLTITVGHMAHIKQHRLKKTSLQVQTCLSANLLRCKPAAYAYQSAC